MGGVECVRCCSYGSTLVAVDAVIDIGERVGDSIYGSVLVRIDSIVQVRERIVADI